MPAAGDQRVRVKRGGAVAPGGGGGYGNAGYGGFGYGGSAGAYAGGGSGGYGGINEGAAAYEANSELSASSYVANHAANAAIANVVRNDYNGQLSTTAQFVAQYTAPVTQDQLHNAYQSVRNQQAAGDIASALAAASPTIWNAANSAANSNFAQAYQVSQGASK